MHLPVLIIAAALTAPPEESLPELWEAERFPSPAVTAEQSKAADKWFELLKERYWWNLNRETAILAEWEDAHWCRSCWQALYEARNTSWACKDRREALGRLRGLIGPEMFYAGQMPPPVPTWRLAYFD